MGVSARLDGLLCLDATAIGSDDFGDVDFGRDRAALLHDKPDNVFVVKMNYWLGR